MRGRFRAEGRKGRRPPGAGPRSGEELERAVLALFKARARPLLGSREIVRRLRLIRGQVRPLNNLLGVLEKKGVLERVGGRFRMRRVDGLVEGVLERGADGIPRIRDGDRLLRLGDVGEAQEGDRIRAQEFEFNRVPAAEFLGVVEGSRRSWVGIIDRGSRGHVLVPYRGREQDSFPIASRDLHGAEVGEMVVAQPLAPRAGRPASSLEVIERLGRPGDREADFRAVVWHRDLPTDFSPEVLAEADGLPDRIAPAELERRLDLRDRCFITIDPETARDHDDAVFVEEGSRGIQRLWVAIADVSHFIPAASGLDRAAWIRGNSIYFPGRSIPMLPERISSDLCSLKPDVDRLVMVVEMEVDGGGQVRNSRFHEGVIRSRARLSYAEAATAMEDGSDAHGKKPDTDASAPGGEIAEQLSALAEVTRRVARHRASGLSMDFDLPQPVVVLAPDGRPKDIQRAERGPAHRAIEEAMLAANRAVAEILLKSSHPGIYRAHEAPAPQELGALADLYRAFGFPGAGRGELLDRAAIARTLRESSGRPEEGVIHYSTLRAMKRAQYATVSKGHFALGFDAYLHFTSPIRRYADLAVHRALRRILSGESAPGEAAEWATRVAIRTSARERLAVAAEREMIDLARCAVMRRHIGDEFVGRISGVAEHGLYITLDDPFVEGMVRISRLSGFFDYDPARHRLVARGSRFQYRIGDRMKVVVVSVNSQRGWIDLDPVAANPKESGQGSKKSAKPRKSAKSRKKRPGRGPGRGGGVGKGRRR